LPPSCADCLEIWEPQPAGTLRACQDLQWDCLTSLPFQLVDGKLASNKNIGLLHTRLTIQYRTFIQLCALGVRG
jgi:hypothetical protein